MQENKLTIPTVFTKHEKGTPVGDDTRKVIKSMYSRGISVKVIVEQIGVSKSCIYKILNLNKSNRPLWTDEEESMIGDLIIDGKTYSEIAQILGRSRNAVEIKLCRMRKERDKYPNHKRILGKIKQYYKQGVNVGYILKCMRKVNYAQEVMKDEGISTDAAYTLSSITDTYSISNRKNNTIQGY